MTADPEALPELPEPDVMCDCGGDYYTASQMHAFYRQGMEAGIRKGMELAKEPQVAFCPACFDAVKPEEMYAEALDARRYRWFRTPGPEQHYISRLQESELDAAIDAAIRAAIDDKEQG